MTGFWKIASWTLVAGLVGTSVACGSDDGGDSGDPLTCESLTLCTYAEVTNYHVASIAEPAGGTIADGQYRLAWVETERADDDGRLDDLEAMEIRGDQFRLSSGPRGDLGELTRSGSELTLHTTQYCDLSVASDTAEASWTYGYTATASELRLYDVGSSGGEQWKIVRVFRKMGDPGEACDLVSSVPTAAGESAYCWSSNCFCAVAMNEELGASSCPF